MPNMFYKQPLPAQKRRHRHNKSETIKKRGRKRYNTSRYNINQLKVPLFCPPPSPTECLFTDSFEILRSNMLSWNLFFIRRLHDADVKSFPVEKASLAREAGERSVGESSGEKWKFVYTDDKIPRDRFDGRYFKIYVSSWIIRGTLSRSPRLPFSMINLMKMPAARP